VNYYDVEDYNQKEEELKINFMTIVMIQCYNCYQIFNSRNTLFHYLHSKIKITHYFTDKGLKSMIILAKLLSKLLKIVSTSTAVKDIKTDWEF